LIIKFPNRIHKAVVDTPVSLADLFPTVLETLHHEASTNVDGRSLLSGNPHRGPVFSENHPVLAHWSEELNQEVRTIVSGTLKLINSTRGRRELYDLSKDPGETRNLYGSDHLASKALETALDSWVRSRPPSEESSPRMDPSVLERLRSLGYLQ
jgi:arylsulfatase A-like enzyme